MSPRPKPLTRPPADLSPRAGRGCTFLALALLAASCGYRLAAPHSTLPGGVTRVHVPVLSNRTAEPDAEALFTRALRDHLHRAGRLADADAPARLVGELVSVSSAPLVASPGRLPNYRLTATLVVTLERDGAPPVRAEVSGGEDFPAGADVLWAESYRAAALARLADALAREALDRLAAAP